MVLIKGLVKDLAEGKLFGKIFGLDFALFVREVFDAVLVGASDFHFIHWSNAETNLYGLYFIFLRHVVRLVGLVIGIIKVGFLRKGVLL